MSQTSIFDYYTIIKKKPDELGKLNDGTKVLTNDIRSELNEIKKEIKNQILDDDQSTNFKVPTTPLLSKTKQLTIKLRDVKSDSFHLNKNKSTITDPIDKESILKWTKRTINVEESSSEKKKKRIETTNDSSVRPSSTVKKRLFDFDLKSNEPQETCSKSNETPETGSKLDELRSKLLNADASFLNKLKEFKEKTASPVKLRIDNLNSPSKRLQEREERRNKAKELIDLSPRKFLEKKLLNSPIKSSPVKFRTVEGLNLPSKYKVLIHNFHCLESVVSMLFNRMETCTFDKVKSGIQKITKKNFDLSHIAQILTIYPESYRLSYEKKTAVDNLNNLNVITKKSSFYLVLAPKLSTLRMTPTVLKSRREQFEQNLNRFARKLHNDYLLSLEPPVIIKEDELTRWHPSYIFPNIPESKLPDQPTSINETKTLNDFWSIKLNIESPPINKIEEQKIKDQKIKDQNKNKIVKGLLKGLSQEFLDKIKNKEAVNLAKEMTRKPEVEKKIAEIRKLPELIRIIHSYFTTEKKKAILLSNVINKCLESSTTFSSGNCSDLIYLTNEQLPDWLLILKTSQGIFIKINKETTLKSLYDRLDRSVIKLKAS